MRDRKEDLRMRGRVCRVAIESVVKAGLCTGCGTCVALCPNSALRIVKNDFKGIYLPKLDRGKCNKCRICYDVCPGHEVDFRGSNSKIFGKESDDVLIGNHLNCYVGHAMDYDIRYNSASGGLVTALLVFALEEGLIDGALVTKMSRENPLEPQAFIARTKEEVILASKSKYCPVPANIALKDVLQSNGKFAVIGLPCHLHGIRKAEQVNKKLREKIVLHLGIFCGHVPNFDATKFLLRSVGVHQEDVREINYRGRGWPGGISIILKDGRHLFVPHSHSYAWGGIFSSVFFTPFRCLLCIDGTNELADISFGDAWLPDQMNDKVGTSIIVSRDRRGDKILQIAALNGIIALNAISKGKVIRSQERMLNFKKKNIRARIRIFKLFRQAIPLFNYQMDFGINHHPFGTFLFCIINLLIHNGVVCRFLNYAPAVVLLKSSWLINRVGRN